MKKYLFTGRAGNGHHKSANQGELNIALETSASRCCGSLVAASCPERIDGQVQTNRTSHHRTTNR